MKKISKNIAHLRHLRGVSQEYLANDLNITRSRLSSWEEHRAEPPIDLIVRLSEYFNVSIDSLLKIDLTKVNDLRDLLKIGGNRILFPVMVDGEGKDLVELVPIRASAGYLQGYSDESFIESLPRISLPFTDSGKFRGFPIQGDSMPPIEQGAYIIGKYVEELTDIKDGKTYVVLTQNDGLVYKRLYNKLEEDGTIHLHSDNKAYYPYQVKPEEVFELWSFVCSLNPSDSPISDLVYNSIQNLQADVAELKNQRIA
ncbi:LexA family transcriptional regulator [Lacihabitans sp. LS3-19]|uniref:XRE family transcriptional regulator n=1 Tax=Lacihabitans sp. LS3-19 TaxID=2487335 RepID=UPI0020CFC8FB|nr:LexA family transcriptional regulator [Lacihabitans sp. LS3-19]